MKQEELLLKNGSSNTEIKVKAIFIEIDCASSEVVPLFLYYYLQAKSIPRHTPIRFTDGTFILSKDCLTFQEM